MKGKMLLGLAMVLCSLSSHASLTGFRTFTGTAGLSTEGFGNATQRDGISAPVPAGATALAAYLYTATSPTTAIPAVALGGNAITFGPRVPNATDCCNLASTRADVSGIVKPIMGGGGGGSYGLASSGRAGVFGTGGRALTKAYEDASQSTAARSAAPTGFASVTRQPVAAGYVNPLDPSGLVPLAATPLAAYGCCQSAPVIQTGSPETLTVSAIHDPYTAIGEGSSSPGPYIANASSPSPNLPASSASPEDNMFAAPYYPSGIGELSTAVTLLETPEPAVLGLMLLGLGGLSVVRRRKRAA